jgi:hypothetical protein
MNAYERLFAANDKRVAAETASMCGNSNNKLGKPAEIWPAGKWLV